MRSSISARRVENALSTSAGMSLDVGDPVADLAPLDAERDGQVVAQLRLVQVADRLGRRVQPAGVERRPLAVLAEHHVRHEHVGVEVRVAVARGAMPERRGDQSLAADLSHTTVAAPRPHGVALGEVERRLDRVIVGVARPVGPCPAHRVRRARTRTSEPGT